MSLFRTDMEDAVYGIAVEMEKDLNTCISHVERHHPLDDKLFGMLQGLLMGANVLQENIELSEGDRIDAEAQAADQENAIARVEALEEITDQEAELDL